MQISTVMITLASVCCPPRYSIKLEQYEENFETLGNVFIAGGDYNANHTVWGSRLVSPKGRSLFNAMKTFKFNHVFSGSPMYWPSDCNKIAVLMDFCVTILLLKLC